MSTPGTLTAALAYVPNWWQETTEPAAFDALLSGWARACGWRACGFVWASDSASVTKTVQAGLEIDALAPPEVPDALRRLKSGESTVLYSVPGTTGRVFAAVQPAGRPIGVLWAEKTAGQPWADGERAYLALVAKTVERAPALSTLIGPVIDPERLYQRLGDVAVIAGRMAHDFDNLLQGIIGFSDLTLPLLQPGSQPASFVAEIGKVGQRGIQFTQQLHHLSRSGQVKPNPGTVSLALAKEETRLKIAAQNGIRIEKDFAPNLPPAAVEAGPLQIVLGHLLENAVEACPSGGVVRVSARPVELSDADARGYLGRVGVGGYLQITVSDTGPGIKPEVRRRLFVEPFFTTKVRHRGLGLAIVYRVLCSHRGGIQLEPVPSPGTGTQVRVVLPLAAARPPAVSGSVTANAVGG
ncbi:multi-sensor hybrid histidine kinase : Histidine kinase OS=uncultured planctomycete GN=HGMM_F01A04C16 PE=4 SV=1: HATPase_c [Gemmata massiliana]|uniref:histidine kinase n=1 Tax=Gemmata massiliana TaxID=1210884 RepID=A0A6P2D7U6_9BACT|nr:HAMP domain-containing sensor histidine kinase [Gemmata massiliana]VTR97229.1 multi-sensor hybrid histidine kinase : Histidine kinase OS=uncultured planctomycete GN=HGMM_F01A04C16 PE=4 SV=1: HATPase_c [Gemmata massiliana]